MVINDPIRRLTRVLVQAAVWGAWLLAAACVQNLPLWNGRLWLLPAVPMVAGRVSGRRCGWFTGIAAGLLWSWTAGRFYGSVGVILGLIGWGMGRGKRDDISG